MATERQPNTSKRPYDGIDQINKYDFHTESKAVFKARKGLDAEIVAQISEMKGEAGLDARLSPRRAEDLPVEADASNGAEPSISTFRTSTTT